MGIQWSTFVLEIINFLVLVWLLKRFLYQPVKRIVERRRLQIEEKLAEAERLHQESEAMKQRYEARLAEWEEEKKKAREELRRELESERQRHLNALRQELDEERRKAEVVWEQEKIEWRRHTEEQALLLGAAFCARMLSRLADEHLHHRLLTLLLEDLPQLSDEEKESLRRNATGAEFRGRSAYPLSEEERLSLSRTVEKLLGRPVPLSIQVDPDLIAGIRLQVGAYVIRANLHDELEFFSHG